MELFMSVLPFVALLACPLMMVFCVFGMRKMGCAAPATTSQAPAERVAALQQQLGAIQTELAALQATETRAAQAATGQDEQGAIATPSGAIHVTRQTA